MVGGGEETPVYGQDGWQMFSVTLTDGRVHSMASVSHDGKFLVIGEAEGRVAAFARARSVPLWVEELQGRLLALTLSGNGKVVAAVLRDQWLLLRAADGSVMTRRVYGPARIATTAVSWDGGRMGLLWKRLDGRMVVEFLNQRRIVFARELGRGTVPLLQMDDRGHWLAVGDVLGMTAALYSSTGRLVWEGREIRRAAVAVAPDGSQAAVAQGRSVQVLSLPSGRPIWRSRLPGAPHLLRLAGPRLAILGSLGLDAGIPDRVWFLARGRL